MPRLIIYAIAFLAGFALMGFEILGVRVLSPYYGSSVYVWGAIISVFLAGLSLGYAVGGRLADRDAGVKTMHWVLLVPAALIMLFPLYGYGFCRMIYSLEWDSRLGALVLSTLLFLLPCACIGAVTPMLVKARALVYNADKIGRAAGNIYAVSTAGSIAGTLFTSFFLISWLNVSTGIVLMGVLLAVCGFLSLATALLPETERKLLKK